MVDTTTLAPRPERTQPARIEIEDDATPMARLVARTLRDSLSTDHAQDSRPMTGVVVVRSHDTPQVVTVVVAEDLTTVVSGPDPRPDATCVVDLHARFTPCEEPTGDAALAEQLLRDLRPALPSWEEAARVFWDATHAIAGMPDELLVEAQTQSGVETAQFGEGRDRYLVAGPADLLAGVFRGADDLLVALSRGVSVRGSLSQLSVMTAASWKVRFDV